MRTVRSRLRAAAFEWRLEWEEWAILEGIEIGFVEWREGIALVVGFGT